MPGREGDGIIEKEQRSPSAGCCQWSSPVLELGHTRNPKRAAVVADDLAVLVNQAATVAREQAPCVDGVKITPRIDTITTRHDRILSPIIKGREPPITIAPPTDQGLGSG